MSYQTTELEIAAFLKARGHRLVQVIPAGRLACFEFEQAAEPDVTTYMSGALVSARELFEAHRHLRALIQQLKQHSNQQNRSENREYGRTQL
jgi:hypothetical protein